MVLDILELYDFVLILVGLALLGVALLPRVLSERPISMPIVFVAFGIVAFSLPFGLPELHPLEQSHFVERIAELGVIIALVTAGLKIDRPPSLWGWTSTWRLLAITMPVTIGLIALVGWWGVGLAIPTAMLLGAVMAPTDPVLASEVQLEGPGGSTEEGGKEGVAGGEDEVRFALTSEAGLNDGFAFPFTNLAILMALVGVAPGNWIGEWLLIDVVYRIAVAIVVGVLLGWLIARLVFALPVDAPMAKSMLGLESLAAMFIVYGVIEFIGGYGFIGVFIGAVTLRDYERRHEFYEPLHDIGEQSEQLLMAGIMILFGGLIASGLFAPLTWQAIVVAVAIVFVIRPVAGIVALLGFERKWTDRLAISFFGVRGIGTFYYLAHGLNTASFDDPYLIWSIGGLAILISIVVHGLSATPIVEHALGEGTPS